MQNSGAKETLADRCKQLSAGCDVDCNAVERWNMNLPHLRSLAEAYRTGWLHNVMSRITPLTMRKRDDYLAMADIFLADADAARHLLDKFQTDIELFCQLAGIVVTEHMTSANASSEIKFHVDLYNDISKMLCNKFKLEYTDPIQTMAISPLVGEEGNPFMMQFMDEKFPENRS